MHKKLKFPAVSGRIWNNMLSILFQFLCFLLERLSGKTPSERLTDGLRQTLIGCQGQLCLKKEKAELGEQQSITTHIPKQVKRVFLIKKLLVWKKNTEQTTALMTVTARHCRQRHQLTTVTSNVREVAKSTAYPSCIQHLLLKQRPNKWQPSTDFFYKRKKSTSRICLILHLFIHAWDRKVTRDLFCPALA